MKAKRYFYSAFVRADCQRIVTGSIISDNRGLDLLDELNAALMHDLKAETVNILSVDARLIRK